MAKDRKRSTPVTTLIVSSTAQVPNSVLTTKTGLVMKVISEVLT